MVAGTDNGGVICALDESPNSSGAVAFAAWLASRAEGALRLVAPESPADLHAAARREKARLVVLAVCPGGSLTIEQICELVQAATQPTIVLPQEAAARWGDPVRATRMFRQAIVCGADGSFEGMAAAHHARELARWLRWRLVLVRARPHPQYVRMATGAEEGRGFGNGRGAPGGGLRAEPDGIERLEVHGDPADVIDDVAAVERAAMIAVAPRSMAAERIALEGSVTFDLFHAASRPVLAVGPAAARTWRRPRRAPGQGPSR